MFQLVKKSAPKASGENSSANFNLISLSDSQVQGPSETIITNIMQKVFLVTVCHPLRTFIV